MIKIKFISSLFFVVVSFSCVHEKYPDDCSDIVLLAGDSLNEHFIFRDLDTVLFHNGSCDTLNYYINIDQNESFEFRIASSFCYGITWYQGIFFIETLSPNSKVLLNSSLSNPEVLELNDTIDKVHNAFPGRYELVKCWGYNQGPGKETNYFTGTWRYINKAYIGLVYEDDNYIYNCWLKVGFDRSGSEPFVPHSIILYNIGILKCCL